MGNMSCIGDDTTALYCAGQWAAQTVDREVVIPQ